MTREAEAHSEEDRKHKEEVEARNKADNLVYNTEKLLKENRDKVPESDVAAIESALENCRKAIDEGGTERIDSAVEELTQATHKLADVLYKQAAPQADTPPSTPGDASGDTAAEGEVIDAEYEESDEKKK